MSELPQSIARPRVRPRYQPLSRNINDYALGVAEIAAAQIGEAGFDLRTDRQDRRASFIRQVTWAHLYFGRDVHISLPSIASITYRDHTTVMSGMRALAGHLERRTTTWQCEAFGSAHDAIIKQWPTRPMLRERLIKWARTVGP